MCLCAIYVKLKEACSKSGSNASPFEWLNDHKKDSQMCFYWDMIINLQIDILVYVRAIREGNFKLYIVILTLLMKWPFGLDHYHYARWCSVQLMDLIQLKKSCPDIYKEFSRGHFSFQKSGRQFSKMSPDQLHEQNNEIIKGTSGATHLLNRHDKSGLERWELCAHEISRILTEIETSLDTHCSETSKVKHHKDTPSFQNRFSSDVKKVIDGIIYNPFELGDLTKINNTNVIFPGNVFKDLSNLLDVGQKQFDTFWNDRLVEAKIPVDDPIKKTCFSFLVNMKKKEKKNKRN